ncbi:dihydrofolate reductase family protein [Saxibacter everestensis]|uniref:Dihydrofolate reductase family protein n=1 Tax=Saxibacter everestensis TaxID=2909229 RepID=A0ABY8QWF5_9MICO|nr:dihydrofolate reductase family protein [Brevibacteriaceae bacterium ZFBP1038]
MDADASTKQTTLHQLLPLSGAGREVARSQDEASLVALYREGTGWAERSRWLRCNMVSTIDGAAMGSDGLSGSISGKADKRVFSVLRSVADAVVVGSGTINAERYTLLSAKPAHRQQRLDAGQDVVPTLVIVSSRANVDLDHLLSAGSSPLVVLTSATADRKRLDAIRDRAGSDSVLPVGDESVDLRRGLDALAERGLVQLLSEGGPRTLTAFAREGLLDELDLTLSPRLSGGNAGRILDGYPLDTRLAQHTLLTGDDALIGRWLTLRDR